MCCAYCFLASLPRKCPPEQCILSQVKFAVALDSAACSSIRSRSASNLLLASIVKVEPRVPDPLGVCGRLATSPSIIDLACSLCGEASARRPSFLLGKLSSLAWHPFPTPSWLLWRHGGMLPASLCLAIASCSRDSSSASVLPQCCLFFSFREAQLSSIQP